MVAAKTSRKSFCKFKMILTRKNFYHPFNGSFLGIFQNETFSSENISGRYIEDINLYHQPVISPFIAGVFAIIMLIMCILGMYLHFKLFKILKTENSVLRDLTIIFVLAQIILWPLMILVITTTNFVYPLNKIVGQWFCTIPRFLIYFLVNIISSHSLMAALTRYLFIVHSAKVKVYGKERVIRLFLFLSISIPLIVTIWKVNDGSRLDVMSFVNNCNGKHHEVFLFETSTLNVLKKNFCGLGGNTDGDIYDQAIMLFKQLSCIGSMGSMLIMGSNVIEGIIYYRLFSYMNR